MEKKAHRSPGFTIIAQHMAGFIRWIKPAHTQKMILCELHLWKTSISLGSLCSYRPRNTSSVDYLKRASSLQHHHFALMERSYPVSQNEAYWTILKNSREPCPLLGSKPRQKGSHSQPCSAGFQEQWFQQQAYYISLWTLLYYHSYVLWFYF